jgi:hypothetical protein
MLDRVVLSYKALGLTEAEHKAVLKFREMLAENKLVLDGSDSPRVPNGFNMNVIVDQDDCGTTCCIGGWMFLIMTRDGTAPCAKASHFVEYERQPRALSAVLPLHGRQPSRHEGRERTQLGLPLRADPAGVRARRDRQFPSNRRSRLARRLRPAQPGGPPTCSQRVNDSCFARNVLSGRQAHGGRLPSTTVPLNKCFCRTRNLTREVMACDGLPVEAVWRKLRRNLHPRSIKRGQVRSISKCFAKEKPWRDERL